MFKVHCLGHQGWCISKGQTHVYVDPLLFAECGHTLRPERFILPHSYRVQISDMPKATAIVLTHEHCDHLNFRSLLQFPRSTPIYLSERSSLAVKEILKEIGFKKINILASDKPVQIGTLRLVSFCETVLEIFGDEIDTLPILIFDKTKKNAFFSSVDIWPSEETKRKIQNFIGNATVLTPKEKSIRYGSIENLKTAGQDLDPVYKEDSGQHIKKMLENKKSIKLFPGLSFSLKNGVLVSVNEKTDWIKSDAKPFAKPESKNRKMPKLNAQDWKILDMHLNQFGQFLFGRKLFRDFLSAASQSKRIKPTMAFKFVGSKESPVFEYNIQTSHFDLVKGKQEYAIQCECHPRDFMDMFSAHFEPRLFTSYYSKWLIQEPFVRAEVLAHSLWMYFHPLRNPNWTKKLYKNAVKTIV